MPAKSRSRFSSGFAYARFRSALPHIDFCGTGIGLASVLRRAKSLICDAIPAAMPAKRRFLGS